MEDKTISSLFQRVLIVLFIIIIFAPAVRMISSNGPLISYTEKRTLATFPSFPDNSSHIQGFFSGIDDYLNDHFGFRDWLIYRYQREIKKRFGVVDPGMDIFEGKDNWYYFTENNMLQNFLGQDPLSGEELNTWIASYHDKKRWLQERGILYLMVVTPSKLSVYPEFVTEKLGQTPGTSRLQQIKNALSKSDDSTFVDLGPDLIKNKAQAPLYFKSDTHWTPYGAYVAYLSLAEKIQAMLPGIDFRTDFSFTPEKTRLCESSTTTCGDLTTRLLEYDSFEESYSDVEYSFRCARPEPFTYQFSGLRKHPKAISLSRKCKEATLTALVFRDSFFSALEPYFSENFAQVIYLWKYYDQKNMEELLRIYKPDIVIEERNERVLFTGNEGE